MNYQELSEFRYSRDLALIWLVRNSNIPVNKLLQWLLRDSGELKDYFSDDLFDGYLKIREKLSDNDLWLFPTEYGNLYVQDKFAQNIKHMLAKADMPDQPHHPKKLTPAQFKGIQRLRFHYQRPVFQQTIACALLGYGALRPGEVANLVKKDIDLRRKEITLNYTKGQESQIVPLPHDLLEPMTKYLSYLQPEEPLFISNTGKQWNRKDVHGAVVTVGKKFAIKGINPRKLRSTVTHEMIKNGTEQNVVTLVCRHKDPTTTAKFYTAITDIRAARKAIDSFDPFRSDEDQQ